MDVSLGEWGADRAGELAGLCGSALPDEHLTADELVACCWEDEGVVLGRPDGSGAVSVVVRRGEGWAVGFVRLVVVAPEAHRHGHGRELLDAAQAWAWDQGASDVHLAGSPPFFLWPGVDVSFTPAHALVEACGFTETGAVFDMVVPSSYRHPPPEGIELRGLAEDADVAAIDQLVASTWPEWSGEQRRAVEQGTCLGAFDLGTGRPVGFACHSVNRGGWFGPTGTAPEARHRGVGSALLGQVCADLAVAGYRQVEICWIGPVGFYAAAGGVMSRVFRTYHHPKP